MKKTVSKYVKLSIIVACFAMGAVYVASKSIPNVDYDQYHIDALPAETCKDVVIREAARAKHEHKRLLVKLGGTWCQPCNQAGEFIRSDEVWNIIGKHFNYLPIHFNEVDKYKYLEYPATLDWIEETGLDKPAVSIFAVLDENGKVLTSSYKPSQKRDLTPVGAPPFKFLQIGSFLHLVSEGSLEGFTDDEINQLRKVLEKHSNETQAQCDCL